MACEFENECDENASNDYSHGGNATMKIWRTKSLDDAHPSYQSAADATLPEDKCVDSTRSLHSSFDAALLLDSNARAGKWLDPGQRRTVAYSTQIRSEFAGRKHMRQKFQMDVAEGSTAETFRKQARRDVSLAEPSQQLKFPIHTSSATGSSSVSKRRRLPSQTLRSPVPKRDEKLSDNSHLTGAYQTSSTSEWSLTPQNHFRARFAMPHPTTLSKVRSTGTKTASTAALETTEESESCELSSPSTEPFRFTSFPESLPRLNNPVERYYPESICRRMSFGERNGNNVSSLSREDDGTHDTSISSLSVEGCRPSPMCVVPHHNDLANSNASNGVLEASTPFQGCAGFGKRVSTRGNTSNSPGGRAAGAMRLDFNIHLSPTQMIGNSPRTSSVTSPLKSRNIGENNTGSSFNGSETLTPDRSCSKRAPTTPQDVLLHFPLEAECSPIPSGDQQERKADWEQTASLLAGSSMVSQSAICTQDAVVGVSVGGVELELRENDLSHSSEIARRSQMRPMPDMSAFESGTYASRGDRSTDESLNAETKGLSILPRQLCPPTPVRTPAWASEAGAFVSGRQNSLISTKVLLACPSHVLEGRTSLESSLLEEDSNPESSEKISSTAERSDSTSNEGKPVPGFSQDENESDDSRISNTSLPTSGNKINLPAFSKDNEVISFSNNFEVLCSLGSGAFADAFKVRSKTDGRLYAVKRNRRQFRGIRDRNMALAEVQYMQRLQDVATGADAVDDNQASSQNAEKSTFSLYLLFFYRAWQEDGHFFCQTELCCRDSCKELLDSIRLRWKSSSTKYPCLSRHIPPPPTDLLGASKVNCSLRYLPHNTVWKVCHDIAAGLSHIHSHGLVHHDIKPSNILFVRNPRFGAMCKICDFGLAGEVDSSSDGQEGDTRYMPSELLSSMTRQPSADIFSLGLTLYEIASDRHIELPSEGPLWHQLRTNLMPQLPEFRGLSFCELIKAMTNPSTLSRPTADEILSLDGVLSKGRGFDAFLHDYIVDVARYDRLEEERFAAGNHEDQTPRNLSSRPRVTQSPSLSMLLPSANNLLSPTVQ